MATRALKAIEGASSTPNKEWQNGPGALDLTRRIDKRARVSQVPQQAIERVHQDVLGRLALMLRRKRRYRCLDCDHRFCDRPVSKH